MGDHRARCNGEAKAGQGRVWCSAVERQHTEEGRLEDMWAKEDLPTPWGGSHARTHTCIRTYVWDTLVGHT